MSKSHKKFKFKPFVYENRLIIAILVFGFAIYAAVILVVINKQGNTEKTITYDTHYVES